MNKLICSLILYFLLALPISNFFAQDAPPSPIPGDDILQQGDGYRVPAGPPLNPDAQLYLPETFSPTEIYPPSREREGLLDQTNVIIKPPSIFRAGFVFSAQYGQFDKLPYTDIYLSPYMQIGPLFMMYEVPLRLDWSGAFVTRMWTPVPALISKVELDLYYSKTNHVFKHVQASIYRGTLLFQGHGRFFYDYNPNLYSPYEPFKTFKFSLDVSYFGINYIIANIAQPDLMSAEIFIKPFQGLKNANLEIYKDFKIYAIYGMDLDPFQGFSDILYGFAPNPNSPPFSMLEIGFDIPVYATKNKKFRIDLYGDYAQIFASQKEQFTINSGYGISGGFVMTILERIPIKFEISKAFNHWQPRWVNVFYYLDRPYINQEGVIRNNKFMNITPNLTYFTSSIGFDIPEKAIFFQAEVYGDLSQQDLWLTLSFTLGNAFVKQLSLSINWTMRNIYNLQTDGFLSPENTVIDVNLKYHMLPNMYWGILLKMNGRIGHNFENDLSTIETIPFIFLGVDYSFRY